MKQLRLLKNCISANGVLQQINCRIGRNQKVAKFPRFFIRYDEYIHKLETNLWTKAKLFAMREQMLLNLRTPNTFTIKLASSVDQHYNLFEFSFLEWLRLSRPFSDLYYSIDLLWVIKTVRFFEVASQHLRLHINEHFHSSMFRIV